MKRFDSLFLIMICLLPTSLFAQTKADAKYKKASEELRAQVWAWDMPQFKPTAVPQKYASASKVILAHHTELVADSKTKLAYFGLGFGVRRDQSMTEIVRELIQVNDKAAVEEYSELAFTKFERKSGFSNRAKSNTFVGVRIIKKDGTIREVDADEMVVTKDAASEKKAKLAISGLEIGDLIDYYVATEDEMSNDYSSKPYMLLLFDEAPVLHYSFHGQLGKKYALEYRSYNGAPELKVFKNDDKELIIDVEKKDMPAFESSLWVAPAQQLPLIRLSISMGYRGPAASWVGDPSKPGAVHKNRTLDEIMDEYAEGTGFEYSQTVAPYNVSSSFYTLIVKDAKERAKAMGISYEDLSDQDKAAHLFYTMRFTKLMSSHLDNIQRTLDLRNAGYDGLAMQLFVLLKVARVDGALLTTSPRGGFRMNEIFSGRDLTNICYLQDSKKMLYINSIYSTPFEVPADFDGVRETRTLEYKSRLIASTDKAKRKLFTANPGFSVPAAKAPANSHLEQLAITVNPAETSVQIQRKATITGLYKYNSQRQLILFEDYYESERKLLGDRKSLVESLAAVKKTRALADEVQNAFAEARKNQKQAFIDETKNWFEQEVTNMTDYKVEKMGVRHTDPDMVYSCSFSLDGLIKKAGNNLIMEIGKIQGEPLTIKDEQRKRDLDIHMPFARSIGYDIRIKVPDGYAVEGVEALNKSVENETGYFKAEASLEGQVIKLTVRKGYFHVFEPVANWEKLLAFIDAGAEWTNAKLLFRKL